MSGTGRGGRGGVSRLHGMTTLRRHCEGPQGPWQSREPMLTRGDAGRPSCRNRTVWVPGPKARRSRVPGFGLAALLLFWAVPSLEGQADSGLALRAIRFYEPASRMTQVTAFVRIPYGMMEPVSGEGGEYLRFSLSLRVANDSGRTLYTQQWARQIPPPGPGRENGLDMIRFALDAGAYHLEARVVDSISGREAVRVVPLDAWVRKPVVSDLLLSRALRLAAPGDTIPQPGEVRRGNVLLAAGAEVSIPAAVPYLFYLFETYLEEEASGTVEVRILDSSGEVVQEAMGQPLMVGVGVSALTGQLDVAGLDPGAYSVHASIGIGDRMFVRSAEFQIGAPVVTLGRER